jgi:hypothetical protein
MIFAFLGMSTETKNRPDKTSPEAAKQRAVTILAWIFVALGFVAALYGLIVAGRSPGGFDLTNLSSFGSYAQGTVASLWSLGALFFLYATLLAQRKQISQQDQQLAQQQIQFEAEQKRQQLENAQQDRQFQLQQQSIQVQNFENSFFPLFRLLTEIRLVTSIDHAPAANGPITCQGLECFKVCQDFLTRDYAHSRLQRLSSGESAAQQDLEDAAQEHFMRFYMNYRLSLDQYFRVLYHTIKFVDASQAFNSEADKRRYTSLVRAQLSDSELFLLFYNGVCPHAQKFRPLIEKYGLLEHLDKTVLLHPSHEKFYEKAYL